MVSECLHAFLLNDINIFADSMLNTSLFVVVFVYALFTSSHVLSGLDIKQRLVFTDDSLQGS